MLRLLLVDDEVYVREGLKSLIDWEACGYGAMDEADNGEDALALIERDKHDVVITDIRMPVLDGIQLIQQVHDGGGHRPVFIILSGHDDFKYAQQAVRYGVHDYMLKPIDQDELSGILKRLADKLEQDKRNRSISEQLLSSSMMESIIMGTAPPAFIADWEAKLGITPRSKLHYCFVELNDRHQWRDDLAPVGLSELKEMVQNVMQRERNDGRCTYVHEHRSRLGLLVSEGDLRPYGGKLDAFLQKLQRELASLLGDKPFMYAGEPVQSLERLGESYKTANASLAYKYVEEDSRIVLYERVKLIKLQYLEMDDTYYTELMNHLEEQNEPELRRLVDRLFRCFREKRYAPEAVKTNIQRCVLGVIKTIRGMDGDEKSLLSLEPIVGWYDLNLSMKELKRLFLQFVIESCATISELRKEYIKGDIYKIKQYIESHFNQNISLKSIAAEFFMNPVYLGQLFKKTYGVYFNEFLLQLRVNEAKKLLRLTDLRIYEIAEKVGFSSADYFVTQFEKAERMKPTTYRKQLLDPNGK
jgi:Response regulator containing CheY-like receiver domain and AraC-type DNA-binding domain